MNKELDIELINHYYNNPQDFVVDIIGATPEDYQEEILRAFPQKKRVLVRSGNGVGKTAIESWIILWFLYVFPDSRVIATAPTGHQLTDVLWPEVYKWLQKSKISHMFEWTATSIYHKKTPNTWFGVAHSSNEATNFQGFHEENILFVIDESSGVADEIWEAIRGGLTTLNAYCLACGNPNYLEGWFYNGFHKNKDLWTRFHINALLSKRVSTNSIEELKREFSEESNQYRIRVLGEFPLEDASDIYIPMTLLKYSIFDKNILWEDSPQEGFEYDLGMDPARQGDDEALFLISKHDVRYMQHKTIDIVWALAYAKSDGPQLINATTTLQRKWKFTTVYPDETGMGGFLYDMLKNTGSIPLYPVTFNKRLYPPGHKINDTNKEGMYKQLKVLLELQRKQCIDKESGLISKDTPDIIRIPNIPKLVTQLVSLRYEINEGSGSMKIHHEDGGHDDWADALALSLFRYVKGRVKKSSYTIA